MVLPGTLPLVRPLGAASPHLLQGAWPWKERSEYDQLASTYSLHHDTSPLHPSMGIVLLGFSTDYWSMPMLILYDIRHEVWRDDNDTDNVPKVKKRDGSFATVDKRRGFLDYHRNPEPYRDPLDRVFDWGEIKGDDGHDDVERKVQAARCMDCGTPFCQTHTGCPIHNLIPEWNELVFKDQWKEAIDR